MKYLLGLFLSMCLMSCDNISQVISKGPDRDSIARIREIENLAKPAYIEAYTKVHTLKFEIENAKTDQDKAKVVYDFNRTIGLEMGELKTFDQVKQRLDTAGDGYIQYKYKRAAADISLTKAAALKFEADTTR